MTEYNRRETDLIQDLTSHDMLISLTAKVNSICPILHESRDDLKNFITAIDKRCERRLSLINANSDKVLGRTMAKWLFSILILIIVSMFGAIGMNKIALTKHEIQILQNSENVIQIDKIVNGEK
jgi:hypothetical protein